jgi:uncharacterized protein YecT (DUF1311 family)
MSNHRLIALLLMLSCSPLFAQNRSQQNPSKDERRWAEWSSQIQQLQAVAKSSYSAEMARRKTPECRRAFSTYEMEACMERELEKTKANYQAYVGALRSSEALASPEEQPGSDPPPGRPLRPAERAREFDAVESAWQAYARAQCATAYDTSREGTSARVTQLECDLRLLRDRMSELESVYQFVQGQ